MKYSFSHTRSETQLNAELRFHFDELVAARVREGMSQQDALRAARLEFGGLEQVKEECRDARGLPFLTSLSRDVLYAVRSLRRSPGFTIVAVLTLAVGIGVNAAVFTLTNTVLFKGFPLVEGNDRIAYISGQGGVSYPDFEDWRAEAKSFKGLGIVAEFPVSLTANGGFPESYIATRVSSNAFRLLGQKPVIGRDFAHSDEIPGAATVAILSYGFWERRYGKDPATIGRTITVNGVPTAVIGVMPRGFTFPQKQEMWMPLVTTPDLEKRERRSLWFVFGRLAGGVTWKSARTEMETIGKRLASAYPLTNQDDVPAVMTFAENFLGKDTALIYGSLWGAVGFVLLIACANLANLLLARAIGRSREISIRIALGAGRWRIIRQLLVESVILSSLGGLFGWCVAKLSLLTYQAAVTPPSWFENVLTYEMDGRVVAYLVAISIATGLLFGLAPALRLSKLDVHATLKDGGRTATGGGRARNLASLLVMGEMALAVALLAGAGLMIRSFWNVYNADLGVQPANVFTMLLKLPDAKYSSLQAQVSFFERLMVRLEAIPGMESVAFADSIPTFSTRRLAFELAGIPPAAYPGRNAPLRPKLSALVISPSYFRTLGAAVLSGREFNDADRASSIPVVIVNQRLAGKFWPGEDAIGKRLRLFDGDTPQQWLTVVGVASNIVQFGRYRPEFDTLIYLPYRQEKAAFMNVFVRTHIPPGGLRAAIQREVQAVDSDLPVSYFLRLSERLSWTYATKTSFAVLFLIFAAIALLLASVGLFAVIAHSVSQRTQEIGIRMAIGASARDILKIVLKQVALQLAIGLIVGLTASFAVNRLLKSQLVQVSPADPITLIVASAALILAAALGCLMPARRALRVDPLIALRHE